MPESPDLSSTLQGNEPPKPEDPQPLKGYRRELTREVFEDLAALQCEPEESHSFFGGFFHWLFGPIIRLFGGK